MKTTTIMLELPEETTRALDVPESQAPAELLLAASIKLYEVGRLSVDSAARIARLAPAGFLAKVEQFSTRDHIQQQPSEDMFGVGDLIESMAQRPAMYVGSRSLWEVRHFLLGYRHALDTMAQPDPLDAWEAWIELKFMVHQSAWEWTRILRHFYGTDEDVFRVLPELYREYRAARAHADADAMRQELREKLMATYGEEYYEPEETYTRPSMGDGGLKDEKKKRKSKGKGKKKEA
jgi:hypothetical protein